MNIRALLCAVLPACSVSTYGLPGGEIASSTTTLTSDSTGEATTGGTSPGTTGFTQTNSSSTGAGPTCGDGERDGPEECDDGNEMSDDGCSSTCTLEYRRVFATSQVFTGDLGGVAGADEKCQIAASKLPRPGIFRAWISSGADSPASNFVHSQVPYKDLDGAEIAANWDDLIDGQLKNGISKTETGVFPPESECLPAFRVVWTHTDAAGQNPNLGADCGGWLDSGGMGKVGRLGYTNGGWTDDATLACTCLGSLYCVEQ